MRDSVGVALLEVADLLGLETVSHEFTYRHRATEPVDPERGQGDAHIAFAYAAHRAVVDVDTELGLMRVVELATAQDVGKAMNPVAVEGQIEGGTVQGLGLAVMEDLQIVDGEVRNPVFHRLPDPHHARRAADAAQGVRVRPPRLALRAQRRGRAAQPVVHAGHRQRHP